MGWWEKKRLILIVLVFNNCLITITHFLNLWALKSYTIKCFFGKPVLFEIVFSSSLRMIRLLLLILDWSSCHRNCRWRIPIAFICRRWIWPTFIMRMVPKDQRLVNIKITCIYIFVWWSHFLTIVQSLPPA